MGAIKRVEQTVTSSVTIPQGVQLIFGQNYIPGATAKVEERSFPRRKFPGEKTRGVLFFCVLREPQTSTLCVLAMLFKIIPPLSVDTLFALSGTVFEAALKATTRARVCLALRGSCGASCWCCAFRRSMISQLLLTSNWYNRVVEVERSRYMKKNHTSLLVNSIKTRRRQLYQ